MIQIVIKYMFFKNIYFKILDVICGVDPTAIDYPYIYFSTPIVNPENKDQNYLYRTVCVKECPINLITKIYWAKIKCLPNSLVKNCGFQAAPVEESVLFYDTVQCK